MWFAPLLALMALPFAAAADLPKIDIVGNKFFYANNGSQFLIRGVAYQQDTTNATTGDSAEDYVDPLADASACQRDVKYLADAKTNVIRVYAVDPTKNHDECMKIFADAGIYVIADLSSPNESINRNSPTWTVELYQRYTSVIDMFANYTNVLGFFAGNEVTNNRSNTDASPFVKAAVRDMKAYIKEKDYNLPVGYSSNDDSEIRTAIGDYFACGDIDARADFFGVNMYEWCGDSSFSASGYETQTEAYANMTIPVFMSEYGCNEVQPRKFTEIGTIFSDKMTDVWSGAIVYMYFQETNDYGLVSVDGSSVSTLADYSYYSQEMNSADPPLAESADETASASATLACPASARTWQASPSLPPTPDQGVCECIQSSLKCVVSDDVDEDDYGDLFSDVCGRTNCSAVSVDGKTGIYGAVSFCGSKEMLSYVLNQYYEEADENSSACNFGGSATLASSQSVGSSCKSVVSSVSANAQVTGSTSGATGAANVSASGSSSTGSSGSSSRSSSSASSSSSSSNKSSGVKSARSVSKGELMAVGAMVMCFVGGFTSLFM